jgi:hypothetical protein
MTGSIAWAPYREKMLEQVGQIALNEISAQDNFTAYTADKIARLVIGDVRTGALRHFAMCAIFPQEHYLLPLYFSLWDEQENKISFLVDIMPIVDSLIDEPFRIKYIEPIQPLWDRFSNLAGITPFEDDAVRAVCSIIYTAAVMPIEREGMRLAALAPHTEYLKTYIEFIKDAPVVEDLTKLKEIKRKTEAIKGTLRSYLQRTYGTLLNQNLIDMFFK